MVRYCLLTILFCLGLCYAKAQSSEESSLNKFTERLVSAISRDCKLNDSTKRKLLKYFYEYLVELKRIRIANEDKLICMQKIAEVRMAFLSGLKEKFGNCIYKNYKKIIDHRYPDRSPNRITGRTSEQFVWRSGNWKQRTLIV